MVAMSSSSSAQPSSILYLTDLAPGGKKELDQIRYSPRVVR
jgi:hypothetical protein